MSPCLPKVRMCKSTHHLPWTHAHEMVSAHPTESPEQTCQAPLWPTHVPTRFIDLIFIYIFPNALLLLIPTVTTKLKSLSSITGLWQNLLAGFVLSILLHYNLFSNRTARASILNLLLYHSSM